MLASFLVVILCTCLTFVQGFIDGLYCGQHNCYEVLGVQKDASKADIARAYRRLAKRYHPDMHKTKEAKKKASEEFTLLASAYEVLKDEESRNDYDYMLDNPDEIYRHYYRYYRRKMAPKVDARIVVAVSIAVISIVQYLASWSRYKSAIEYLSTVPKYRLKAMEIAKEQNLLPINRKKNKKPKEAIKEEEESILKKIIETNIDLRGGHSRPSIVNVLAIRIVLLPVDLISYIHWNVRWLWKFTINKEDLGQEEKLYLIRKYIRCSQTQWEAIEEHEKQEYLKKELWIKDNFQVWKQQKEEEMKAKLAESARYKSYRRYMRNHGPGQLAFDE